MAAKSNIDYLDLIEDHRPDVNDVNLFVKILTICNRAKDIQTTYDLTPVVMGSFGYKALREFNNKKINPNIVEKTLFNEPIDDDENE